MLDRETDKWSCSKNWKRNRWLLSNISSKCVFVIIIIAVCAVIGSRVSYKDISVEPLSWNDIITFSISVLAVIISLWHHFIDGERNKKKDTLDAYNTLQQEVFDKLNIIRKKYPVLDDDRNLKERKEIIGCLARIERFSVGINCGIFDISVLKRCGGAYFIRMYMYLENVIKGKRKKGNDLGGKHYDEFEMVKDKLVNMYKEEGVEIKPFRVRK